MAKRGPTCDRCACGQTKARYVDRCRFCARRESNKDKVPCACGRPKSRRTVQCRTCFNVKHRSPAFQCAWCTRTFWRPKWKDDARRFCSRDCFFAMKKGRAADRAESEAAEREIQQALYHAAKKVRRSLRRCVHCAGSMPDDRGGRYCSDACLCAVLGTKVRETRRTNKAAGIQHQCPNCGVWFPGHPCDVYCSPRCCKQFKTHLGRYPSLENVFPIEERNRIAGLIALVRAARRQIDFDQNPSAKPVNPPDHLTC